MIGFALLLAAAPALDAVQAAVEQCKRAEVADIFSAEPQRRIQAMSDAYREQVAIVTERRQIEQRRMLLRRGVPQNGDSEGVIALAEAALANRQSALNDARMLEGLRRDGLDAMRSYYIRRCGAGRDPLAEN